MHMNRPYELLKNYIPVKQALKTREEGDMMIIANMNAEIYYLNGMARDIWGMLDGNITVEGLCAKILGEYEVDRETLEGDIVSFIRDMQWKRLMRLKEGRNPNEEI